jgi:outer membrane receptor protein involved in Fe transport
MNEVILDQAAPRGSRRLALAIAVALGSVPPGTVLAQQALLEEITVTASRRAVSVQDIPLNIAALAGGDIERQRIQNLAELTRLVPGLYLTDQGGRDGNLMTVRGLNATSLNASEFTGNGSGGFVATYLGDIPYYMDLRLLDIERVEALLGPQGTLYGAGTLAGAIRYIPNRPSLDGGSVELGGDVYGYNRGDGLGTDATMVVNVPLLADRLALRASLGWYDTPGFIDYNYVLRQPGVSNPQPDLDDPADVAANLRRFKGANDERTVAGRVGLLWQAADWASVNLTYYYQDQRVGSRQINHAESFGTGRYESASRYLEPNDRENQLLALEVDVDLGFATLTSATGVGRYEDKAQRDQTDLLLAFEFGYEDFPSFSAFTRDTSKEDTINQELRLVSQGDGPWNWIVGAFYNRFELDALSLEFVPGFPGFIGADRADELEYYQETFQKVTERALFGELGHALTDRWDVTVGARWYKFKVDQRTGFDLPLLFGAPEGVDPIFDENSGSDDGLLFKFNTSYQFTDELLAYLTISDGFRNGGVNAVPACLDPLPPGQNVCALPDEVLIEADTTTNYELGLRSGWLDGRLTVNGAVYQVDWDDIQVAGRTENGELPITVNGSKARSRGIELGIEALLAEGLRLTGTWSWNEAELRALAPELVDGLDGERGDRLPGSPKQQASLVLSYDRPLTGALDLQVDYGVTAISDVYTKVGLRNNGEALAGYALHWLSVGVSNPTWTVRAYADNLFDKYAETGLRADRSAIYDVNGFDLRRYYKSVAPPRRVGVEFSYRFDF